MKSLRTFSLAVAALLIAPVLRADVTLRYKNEIKAGASATPLLQFLSKAKNPFISQSSVIQIKGSQAYVTTGAFVTIMDFSKQLITLIDPEHKQYTTVYMKDYADQVLSILPGGKTVAPADAQRLADLMKTSFSSEKTGRTDTVLGIQVEETQLTLTMDSVSPSGAAPSPDATQASPQQHLMRMVIHIWTATPSEIERVSALQELVKTYGSDTNAVMNPDGIMEKTFSQFPGMGADFTKMMDELAKTKAVTLKSEIEIYSPMLVNALKSMPQDGQTAHPDVDPEAPLMEIHMDAVELSAAPIADSLFEVPDDCHVTTVPDFLHALIPSPNQSPSGQAAVDAPTQ